MESARTITLGQDPETRLSTGDVHNILLEAPIDYPLDEELCTDLLDVDDPSQENVLSITLDQAPDDRFDIWQRHIGELPANAVILSVGEMPRSTSRRGSIGDEYNLSQITFESIDSPGNLTKLGVQITEYLAEWRDAPNRTVLCLHSLTVLLQYVDLDVLYRFLHQLILRVRRSDAIAHYHIDPDAHADQTLATLRTLTDTVIETPDGKPRVIQ